MEISINKFKNLGLSKIILKNYTFDSLTNKIMDKKTIKDVEYFIKYISTNYKKNNNKIETNVELYNLKNIRLFLTAYLVYVFPEISSDLSINNDKKDELYSESEKIIDIIEKNLNNNHLNINELYNCIYKYIILMKNWLKKENEPLINKLTEQYWELDYSIQNLKNENNENESIDECRNLQKDILENIKKIGGEDYFNNFVPIFIDEEFYELISNNMKNIFWDKFKEDLDKEPPCFKLLGELLKDVRLMIVSLVPNRIDIHQEIWDTINIDLINQMIEHEAMDIIYMKKLILYIVNKIKIMGSISEEKEINEWEKNIEESFEKGFKLSDFFPLYFKNVFEKLENIHNEIQKIKNKIN